MAQLTDRLPLTQGTNRVIADPGGVDVLGTLADFAGGLFEGGMAIREGIKKQNKEKKEAELEADKQQVISDAAGVEARALETTTTNNSGPLADVSDEEMNSLLPQVESSSAVQSPLFDAADQTASLPETVVNEVQATGNKLINIGDAVLQKKMPPISMEAAMTAEFQRMLQRHPENMDYVLDTWKKMGLDVMLNRHIKDYADWQDHNRELAQAQESDEQKFRGSIIEMAKKALGEFSVGKTDDELYVAGLGYARTDYELGVNKTKTDIALSQANIDEKTRAAIKEDSNNFIENTLSVGLWNDLNPIVSDIQKLGAAVMANGNDPNALAEFQKKGVLVKQMFSNYVGKAVALAQSRGLDPSRVSALRTNLTNQFGTIDAMFSGDASVFKAHNDALTAIQTSMKIDVATAMPMFSALKTAGLKVDEIPGLMDGVMANPQLMEKLRGELKGFTTDFGTDRASTRIASMVKILKGQAGLKDYTPAEQRALIGSIQESTISYARSYLQDKAIDPNLVVEGVASLSTAARVLSPSSGTRVLAAATRGFASENVREAMFKALGDGSVDQDIARATLQTMTAASVQAIQAGQGMVSMASKNDPYYSVRFNTQRGRFELDPSKKNQMLADVKNNPARYGSYGGFAASKAREARPTEETQNLLHSLNINLDNVVAINGKVPVFDGAQNEREIRTWLGTGRMPESLKNGNKAVDVDKEFNKIDSRIQKALDKNLTAANTPVEMPHMPINAEGLLGVIAKGEAGPKGYNSYYGDGQGKNGTDKFNFNLPKPVTEMTVGEAIELGRRVMIPMTRGQIGHSDPSLGTSAIGAYQFTQETLAEFGEQALGAGWLNQKLTPANQDKLAKAIIAATGGDPSRLIGRWPSLRGKV